ncbi:FCD domain-containing protein [Calidifontibacter sp. DB0510]|uniref:FCD domain-containing protein n=1 Tax=Metallococcus carri TaxID=1656884 RepID=A0A967AZP1_9MICO|nr:FCD domain-containing protein [Metallococcus carri]NOP36449.1 FCD domain-containing protein [Calidifontibacter sp. DB2511S]
MYDGLRGDVLGGIFRPGERLKFAPLCERYGASVSVVREALSRLAEQGLVEAEPNVGFRVRTVSTEDLLDLTRTRIEIESLALRRSIAEGDAHWEARLLAAHHVLAATPIVAAEGPPRMSDEWETAHAAFHAALLEGGAGPWLRSVAATLRDASEFYRRLSQVRAPGRDEAAEHRAILDAALAHDADLAVELLRAHYDRTAQILLGSVEFG